MPPARTCGCSPTRRRSGAATSSSAVARRARLPQIDLRDSLPTRSAEALFWLGRNAERAEAATRTTRLVIARAGSDPALLDSAWFEHCHRGDAGRQRRKPERRREPSSSSTVARSCWPPRSAAALDNRSGAVANSLGHLAANAGGVREFLSTATWRVLNELDNERSILSVDHRYAAIRSSSRNASIGSWSTSPRSPAW